MTKFRRKYTVGFDDMDVNYRFTKIAATKYFQETFAMYCAKNKVAAFDLCSQNIVWVISDLHIAFSDYMPYWSEEFEVEIWISEKSAMRTYADFRIYYKNKEIAKGDSCWYLLDMTTRRPVKSADILSIFGVCDEKVFDKHEKQIYKIEGEKVAEKEHQVTVRDLDFNHHVNNLSYIGLALETAPAELLQKYSVDLYNVKFVQEAYLDEVLVCEIFRLENNITAKISKKSDNSDVCFIKTSFSEKKEFGRNPREAGIVFE